MDAILDLTISSICARAVVVPLDPPIQTSGQLLTVAPLILIDLSTREGVIGRSHIFPEFSAHLLSVSPTRHMLEFLDLAAPLLLEPVRVDAGRVLIRETPGAGLDWDETALSRFGVS